MTQERITKQGRCVLECLMANSGIHLTADEISVKLKENGKAVSVATIYRQLEKLTLQGKIRKFTSSPDEPACYQYSDDVSGCANHFHLKCEKCNKLIHVSCEYLDKLEKHIGEHHGFEVDNTRTVLYGICKDCNK